MTGWDPIVPLAGLKRSRSIDEEMTFSVWGRPTKKVNYYKSHHEKVVKTANDPKT